MPQHAEILTNYGATVEVYTIPRHRGKVYLGHGEGSYSLSQESARELAEGLLKAAGEKLVPLDSIPNASNVSFNEAMLRVAVAHKRTVRFRYAKDEGEYIETRTIQPNKMVGTEPHKAVGVLGYDPDRDDTRRYRLDRIKGEVEFA